MRWNGYALQAGKQADRRETNAFRNEKEKEMESMCVYVCACDKGLVEKGIAQLRHIIEMIPTFISSMKWTWVWTSVGMWTFSVYK